MRWPPQAKRKGFVELFPVLESDPQLEIVAATTKLLRQGVKLYSHRLDKDWSLTDCISFIVMEERGMSDGLTGDHHFEQADFRALLKLD